jgi:hypothetical protein
MDSTPANSTSPGEPARSSGPQRGAVAMVALTLGLLGALVWALTPRPAHFTPAPLGPAPPDCPKLAREFVPTNITGLPGSLLVGLSPEQKMRALYRLNMEPCPCGCNSSVAYCLITYPNCETSRKLAEKIVAEVKSGQARHQ